MKRRIVIKRQKTILPEHWEDLRNSGLREETVKQAGVYSVPPGLKNEKLRSMNIPGVSALAFPYGGGFERYKLFPPQSDRDGKKIKYFQPPGSPVRLYVPPLARKSLSVSSVPLYITEGEKKALKANQEGFPCVGLGGIWNFKTKKKIGLIDDLLSIRFKGRKVYIVPDSDLNSNSGVMAAVQVLGLELENLGAQVCVITLPSSGASKVGFDDFLVKEGPKAFISLPRLNRNDPALQPTSANHPYAIHKNQLCVKKQGDGGAFYEPLCNFEARATEEVVHDDGEEKTKYISLTGKQVNGTTLPEIRVPMADFYSMRWIGKFWGFGAVVRAGQAKNDQLREAIQRLSPAMVQRTIYTHTGWRKAGNKMVFLFSGGAIGAENMQVQLDSSLERYRLPSSWTQEDARHAAMEAKNFLEVGAPSVTIPLFAAVHLAPFVSSLEIDFTLWLLGATGTLKSTLAALMLGFYGDFSRTTLPGSWDSTENALLKKCFTLKDLPFVIDDFSPPANAEMARVRERQAERIIRSVGNGAGRDRLRSDLTSRVAHRPRCLLIATGEQLPSGQSLLARICPIPILKGEVNKSKLTSLQEKASLLPVYTAGYLSWCSERFDNMIIEAKKTFMAKRAEYQSEAHMRIPEMLAWLHVGFGMGLQYLGRFHDRKSIMGYEEEAHTVFMQIGKQLSQSQKDERESYRFLKTVWVLLRQGTVALFPSLSPGGCIGWADDTYLYLRPEPAYHAVTKYFRDEGSYLGLKSTMLHKMLFEDGLLIKSIEENRYATKETNRSGAQERVLKFPISKLEKVLGPKPWIGRAP